MREIKFKAYVEPLNPNEEKVGIVDVAFMELPTGKIVAVGGERYDTDLYKINLMQSTGLYDKNMLEIFEGYIINVFDTNEDCWCEFDKEKKLCEDCNLLCTQKVEWQCGYFAEEEIGDFCPPLAADGLDFEIIGNIYENPELIKNN